MKKLTYKGKDVKVVKAKRMDDCIYCIFDENCINVSGKWERENKLTSCIRTYKAHPRETGMVKYLYV